MNTTVREIIVTGGRNFSDEKLVSWVLNLFRPTYVIQGGAPGADELARKYALKNDIPLTTYTAAWELRGRAAGPLRNRRMVESHPNAWVIAFPGGTGTENCIKVARALKNKVIRVSIQ